MLQLLCAWIGAILFLASLAYFLFAYAVTFGETGAAGARLSPILINVLLFSAFALHHSAFARTGIKAAIGRRWSPAVERSLYTWVASLLFLVVCWAWRPVAGVLYEMRAPWHWIGYAAQLAGVVITIAASRRLDMLDLAGVRATLLARSGELARHVPLQTAGLFALVRHPIYLGWLLFVFGAPRMTITRFVFACVSTAYLAAAIPLEERGLIGVFGDEYAQYQRRVRWRMLPGVY